MVTSIAPVQTIRGFLRDGSEMPRSSRPFSLSWRGRTCETTSRGGLELLRESIRTSRLSVTFSRDRLHAPLLSGHVGGSMGTQAFVTVGAALHCQIWSSIPRVSAVPGDPV